MAHTVYNVLNLGAGWQSTWILLASCRGEIPKFDGIVFADTEWEPKAVYEHLDWLDGEAAKAGMVISRVTAGPIRDEILEFMRSRKQLGRKRYASAPMFIKKPDGSAGRMQRQCTKEFKIEPCELWARRKLLGLKPGQRVPKNVLVHRWYGISDDEASRATFPGQYRSLKTGSITTLYGESLTIRQKKWFGAPWQQNVYPLLNEIRTHDRKIIDHPFLPRRMTRHDIGGWFAKHLPGRTIPRSACIGCPFRSNQEWKEMRDKRPEEWADACDFDDAQRLADAQSTSKRAMLVGTPYVHRQLVPLRMVDLDGHGEKGGGCGTLFDGQDGLCGI
jgi:hypothetical protein